MVYLILSLTFLVIGFICGKYSERIGWNKLIERGVLPRPGVYKSLDFNESEDFKKED